MVSAPPPIGLATFSANAPVTTRVPAYAARLRVRGAVSVRVVVAPATGPVVVNGEDTAAAKKADSVMVQPAKARVPAPRSEAEPPFTISAVAPPRVRVLLAGTVRAEVRVKAPPAAVAVTANEPAASTLAALTTVTTPEAPTEIAPLTLVTPARDTRPATAVEEKITSPESRNAVPRPANDAETVVVPVEVTCKADAASVKVNAPPSVKAEPEML